MTINYKKKRNPYIEGLNSENYRFKKHPKINKFWDILKLRRKRKVSYKPAPVVSGLVYRHLSNGIYDF